MIPVKKQGYIAFALFLAVIIAFFALREGKTDNDTSMGLVNQCEFVNSLCQINHNDNVVLSTFSSIPEVEASITVNFSLPPFMDIDSVWIEGVNMYMGKVPVLVEKTEPGIWSGWFMLGVCSEPVMRWKMVMYVKNSNQPYLFFFDTKMP
ncbi:hypothetical protein [Aestuariibacter sp. A3R04]|uniref:hypothetical protein n=1 Tax=Aestuariibacter sp. A3R04 TaxID=2841571 RepID=UPI001C09F816|nr:hypothetical protein [Aestuariibacter sp. A3R04]MBU3022853.1 hypothetical protein [Aestuariibacter sp. A3R04]